MWWPFGKRNKTPAMSETEWVAKSSELARRVIKVKDKIGPQVARTIFTGQNPARDAEQNVQFEVLVFCLHVCERYTRQRFAENVPVTLTTLLVDRAALQLTANVHDELTKEKVRSALRAMYSARNEHYKTYDRVRATRGDSEHGTLVDGFGKLMTATYAGKNALARAMLSAQAIELVKTMPVFLDEVGLRAA